MKPTVLVTAIGTITATGIVRELKKTNSYYIIGADINESRMIASSLDVDEYYVFPLATADNYLDFVLEFCRNNKVEYYFAVIDKEVILISQNRNEFEKIGTKLCVANYEFASICHYKNVFQKWVNDNYPQISIQTFDDVNDIRENDYPLFVKPIEGVASTGCKMIENHNDLVAYSEKANGIFLIQKFISGQIYTVDLIRNRKTNQKMQIQRIELLRNKNGCGIAVEICDDSRLTDICNFLMEKLDLNGVANAEFFYDGNDFRIIEINPRFSAGSQYSCYAGVNTVMNAIYIADENECIFGDIRVGSHFAERYEIYCTD